MSVLNIVNTDLIYQVYRSILKSKIVHKYGIYMKSVYLDGKHEIMTPL